MDGDYICKPQIEDTFRDMHCDGFDYDSDDDGDNDYANYIARVGRRYAPRWS